jgi:hypothetical protein
VGTEGPFTTTVDKTVICAAHCPPGAGDPNFGSEDVDGDGVNDILQEIETDDQGNKFEQWATQACFDWAYTPYGGTRVWAGVCIYSPGLNEHWKRATGDANHNETPDWFEGSVWFNKKPVPLSNGKYQADLYVFDAATNHLTKTRFELDHRDDPVPSSGGVVKYDGPAPSSPGALRAVDPPDLDSTSVPSAYVFARTMGGPAWDYGLEIDQYFPLSVTAGDKWTLYGDQIDSASTTGDAASEVFGAWVVDTVDTHFVTFEATQDALVRSTFGGFDVYAPSATQGVVSWLSQGDTMGDTGIALGPTPEPSSIALMVFGLMTVLGIRHHPRARGR